MKRNFIEVARTAEEENDSLLAKKQYPEFPSLSDFETGSVVANEIQTQTLQIDGAFLGHVIKTPNGDIAYHFYLNDQTESFEEGEVVGFVQGEKRQTVQKLILGNCKDVKLKGVVTRSQYFEAQKPKLDDVRRTEKICMLGQVPVKVMGSVRAQDSLYSSTDHPGVAVSYKKVQDIKSDISFIGVAMSTRLPADEESIGFVQALVSLGESLGQRLANEKLEKLENSYNNEITRAKGNSRCFRKICVIVTVSVLILLGLLGVLLWQLYFPGTAYKYWKCKQGRKIPEAMATFKFVPYRDINKVYKVKGIEFTYHGILQKKGYLEEDVQPLVLNNTSVRYYLNIDRCAHGKIRKIEDKTLGLKVVAGPNIFAVNGHCNRTYYHDGSKPHGRWKKYNSASEIHCSFE